MIQPQVCPGAPSRIQQITRCTDEMATCTRNMKGSEGILALLGFMDWYEELYRLIWEEQ